MSHKLENLRGQESIVAAVKGRISLILALGAKMDGNFDGKMIDFSQTGLTIKYGDGMVVRHTEDGKKFVKKRGIICTDPLNPSFNPSLVTGRAVIKVFEEAKDDPRFQRYAQALTAFSQIPDQQIRKRMGFKTSPW